MNSPVKKSALLLMLVCFTTSLLAQNNDPSQFRGNNCSGIAAPNAAPPVNLLPGENLAWKTEVASGVSSPCIWGNKIFLTGFNPTDSALITYCINRENGDILWKREVFPDSLEKIHAVGSHAAATPTTNGNLVIVYFGSYGILCYDRDGNQVWGKKLPISASNYGSCASPIMEGNLLFVNRREELLALEVKTGDVLYSVKINNGNATPVIWQNQLLLHQSWKITSLNLSDGSVNWNFPLITVGPGTPVIEKDLFFLNGFTNLGENRLYDEMPEYDGMLSLINENEDSLIQIDKIPESLIFFRRPELDLPYPDDTICSWQKAARYFDSTKDGAMNKAEWEQMLEFSKKYMHHGVVALKLSAIKEKLPELLWKENNFVSEVPSLLCSGNQIYMITNGGFVTCMNSQTGEVIYREKLGASGAYLASPLLAGGNIYFTSYNGSITVVKPDDKLHVVSKCNLKEKIAASPVAAGNTLYVRTLKGLFAFENNFDK